MSYERKLLFFIDTKTTNIFLGTDAGAVLLGANVPAIQYGELVDCSFQLTDGAPAFDAQGGLSNPYTDLAGSGATSEIVVDNNFNWYDPARLGEDVPASEISTLTLTGVNFTPRQYGAIRLGAADIVHYCAWTASENAYTFTLADNTFAPAAFTPSQAYTSGAAVRIIEQPVIVSANNSATPASGLFSGILDAGNPVYEELVEGTAGIGSTQLEFSVYVAGRCVFRIRFLFDCLGAIDPGPAADWIRPDVWTQADSRYIQYANLTATATAVSSTSPASVTVNRTGDVVSLDFEIPRGADGTFTDTSFLTFDSVSASNTVTLATACKPVSLRSGITGKFYPIEKGSVTLGDGAFTLDLTPYLVYDDAATFSGTWTVFMAAGLGGTQADGNEIITLTSTAITPAPNTVFRKTLAADDAFTIDTSGLTATRQMTFELHLIQPSTAVSFTLPASLVWAAGDEFNSTASPPAMSTGGKTYAIVIRWDGEDLLANLAYTKGATA